MYIHTFLFEVKLYQFLFFLNNTNMLKNCFWILSYFCLNTWAQKLWGKYNEEEGDDTVGLRFKNQKPYMCTLFHAISFIRQALFSLTTHGKEGNFITSKFTSLSKVLILAGLGAPERCTLAAVVLYTHATWIKGGSASHLHRANTATWNSIHCNSFSWNLYKEVAREMHG